MTEDLSAFRLAHHDRIVYARKPSLIPAFLHPSAGGIYLSTETATKIVSAAKGYTFLFYPSLLVLSGLLSSVAWPLPIFKSLVLLSRVIHGMVVLLILSTLHSVTAFGHFNLSYKDAIFRVVLLGASLRISRRRYERPWGPE